MKKNIITVSKLLGGGIILSGTGLVILYVLSTFLKIRNDFWNFVIVLIAYIALILSVMYIIYLIIVLIYVLILNKKSDKKIKEEFPKDTEFTAKIDNKDNDNFSENIIITTFYQGETVMMKFDLQEQ